jgi:hypothetical protein
MIAAKVFPSIVRSISFDSARPAKVRSFANREAMRLESAFRMDRGGNIAVIAGRFCRPKLKTGTCDGQNVLSVSAPQRAGTSVLVVRS